MFRRRLTDWLQRLSARQRMRLLTSGHPTELVPNERLYGARVERLLTHKHVATKGQTVVRDVIRYFQYPADCHQENIDEAPLHRTLARATGRLLAIAPEVLAQAAAKCVREDAPRWLPFDRRVGVLRLRDVLIDVTTRLMFQLIFGREISSATGATLSRSTKDVIRTIKGIRLPELAVREQALVVLYSELQSAGGRADAFDDDVPLSTRAKHLQGVFFHTGCIQVSEFVTHVLIEVGKQHAHAELIRAERGGHAYLDNVLAESLRLFPLFGITNRVAVEDVDTADGATVPAGTQIVVDFERHHRHGYDEPDVFAPERWLSPAEGGGYMPFGVGSRRCPAERFSRIVARALVRGILQHFDVYAPVEHRRSIDGGGLCCLVRRNARGRSRLPVAAALTRIGLQDACEQLWYPIAKLIWFPRIVRAAKLRASAQSPTPGEIPPTTCPLR